MAQRRKLGHDLYDECWDGVWHMPPMPSIEHHRIERELSIVLTEAVDRPKLGRVFHEVNVADPEKRLQDFRVPDLAVVLPESYPKIQDVLISGSPEFIVEIYSPGDESYEKLPWYFDQGAIEVLIIHRDTKAFALYRRQEGGFVEAGASPSPVDSQLLPLRFELVEGSGSPRLRITHRENPDLHWEI
jgi:Uma2 family endonuclease